MPQLVFLQALVIAALIAFALAVVAFPVAAKVGWRAGRVSVRLSLAVLVFGLVGSVMLGASNGELSRFRTALGPDAALQMGMFFLIMYSTAFLFVSRYITTLAAEAVQEDDIDA